MTSRHSPLHVHLEAKLENLHIGLVDQIEVMVCRKWSNKTPDGAYSTTDYLLSDRLGNIVQCYVIRHVTPVGVPELYEGKIYRLRHLLIVPAQTSYRVLRENEHVLLFWHNTTAMSLDADTVGFIRYPFQFVAFECIEYVNHKYLIDVAGHVIWIGDIEEVPGGFRCLRCRLINDRGMTLKITVWDHIYELFLEKRAYAMPNTAVIFTGMSIERHGGTIYLQTTLDTSVYNATELGTCPVLASVLLGNNPFACTITSLDKLHDGMVGGFEVMVIRRWDRVTLQQKNLSTEYLLSDRLGNIIQCTVLRRGPLSLSPQLYQGRVYHISDVLVNRNQDAYRVCKENNWCLLFLNRTTIAELEMDTDGFRLCSFNFIAFDDIKYVDYKYLIDIVGYVHSVGTVVQLPGRCACLECKLIDARGSLLEVILWGRFAEDFLAIRTYLPETNAIIFAGMTIKQSSDGIYLISTMDTSIYGELEIDESEQLSSALSAV